MRSNVLYTVRQLVDDRAGVIHGSTDAELTCCGIDMENGDWEVVTNAFDGRVRCTKCLKRIQVCLPHELPSSSKLEVDERNAVHYVLGSILFVLMSKTRVVTEWPKAELSESFVTEFKSIRTDVVEPEENEILIDPDGLWYSIDEDVVGWFPKATHSNNGFRYCNCQIELMNTYGDEDVLAEYPYSVYGVGMIIDRRLIVVADFFRIDGQYELRNVRSASIANLQGVLVEPSSKRMFYHYRDKNQLSLRVDRRMYSQLSSEYRELESEDMLSGPRALLSLDEWYVDAQQLQHVLHECIGGNSDGNMGLASRE